MSNNEAPQYPDSILQACVSRWKTRMDGRPGQQAELDVMWEAACAHIRTCLCKSLTARRSCYESARVGNTDNYWWCGEELPDIVRSVLSKKARWNDPAYLNRMLFSAMIGNAERLMEETGFSISVQEPDNTNGRPTLVIDHVSQSVSLGPDFEENANKPESQHKVAWSFAQFAKLPVGVTWDDLIRLGATRTKQSSKKGLSS